jgi:hypothetical protein
MALSNAQVLRTSNFFWLIHCLALEDKRIEKIVNKTRIKC